MRKFMFRGPAATVAFILSLCFIGLFMINGCRKTDRSAKRTETESAIRSKFFTILPGTDPVVTAIAASIKRQDRHRDFIPGLVQKAGFALWNQARVVAKNQGNPSIASRETNPDRLVLIPFAPANEEQTKAILFVRLSATDTLYHLLYGSQYRQYGFGPANAGWNAKDIFHAFLLFDKAIFGHTQFNITDPRLLTDSTAPAGDSAILEITGISSPFNRSYYEETVCIDYTVCHRCLPFRGAATNSQSDPCCFREDYTTCITYWFDDDDWGWYNPGGGDPGGGGGSPCEDNCGWEGEDPCQETTGQPVTGFCDPGWEPVITPLSGAEHLNTGNVSAEDQIIIDNWEGVNINKDSLDSCRIVMLNKMLTNTHAMGRLLTKLDEALKEPNNLANFNVTYKITSNIPSGNAAFADSMEYDPPTRTFKVIIKLNPLAIRNATDIFISQSIMHETLHAYLTFILERIMSGTSYAQIQNLGYPKMFDTYVDSLINRNRTYLHNIEDSSEMYQHNYMANHLLEFMAYALAEFDDNRINDDEYYWYLSWKGLQMSQPWVEHWPLYNTPNWQVVTNPALSDADKQGFTYALTEDRLININNAIFSEQTSDTEAKGRKPVLPGSNGCYQ